MSKKNGVAVQCVLLGLIGLGCNGATNPFMSSLNPNAFQNLLETSVEELQVKTEAHKAWGLGSFDRWYVNQEAGNLTFSNADGTTAVAPVQIIGSFSTDDNSWRWAWNNPSVVDDLKIDALRLKEYGETRDIEKLTAEKWSGTESDAWAMAALAVKLCDAEGAYRGRSGPLTVFMTFGEVTLSTSNSGR